MTHGFVKTVATIARFSLLLAPVAILATVDCGSSDSNTTGTAGASGTAGHAGTTGGGGSGGSGGSSSGNFPACSPVMVQTGMANIMDFTSATGAATTFQINGAMGGGTFIYPDAGMEVDLKGLTSDVSAGNWHITGLVKKYAGFGLYLSCKTDMSNYAGLSFDVQGTFTGNGMGDGGVPAASVTMSVGDAQTDVDSAHNASPPSWGTCVPATGNQYDGTCASASKAIPLTGAPVSQTVRWTDLTGGKKVGASNLSPDPTQITSIAWALPWSGDGSAQYTVDLTIDNIKFITP
jgi:hypothetical protein